MSVDKKEPYNEFTLPSERKQPEKWTKFLMLCCMVACTASFQFGFNIGSLNQPTSYIIMFFKQAYYPDQANDDYLKWSIVHDKFENHYNLDNFNETDELLKFIRTKMNVGQQNETINFDNSNNLDKFEKFKFEAFNYFYDLYKLQITELNHYMILENLTDYENYEKFSKLKKEINGKAEFLVFKITNALFVIGGMIGALTSKQVLQRFGRKNGIVFHNFLTIVPAILVFIAPYVKSPVCLMLSRTLYGLQGGMACGLVPTYLNEISPSSLRGATGVIHQLCLTIGIFVAQLLGFRQIFGVKSWHVLLALPIIPAIIGALALIKFFPESPKALLINNKDEEGAKKSLQKLRNTLDVTYEMEEMEKEAKDSSASNNLSILQVLKNRIYTWPLITGIVLQFIQQFSGINAIFFYSNLIFENNGIQKEQIQYATAATGLVNIIATIVCVPLIDRLGRKPLLVYPIAAIVVVFALLTFTLNITFPGSSVMSIILILAFIVFFAIGLGPIPFIYVAEAFNQESRSVGLSLCVFANWIANLFLTLVFDSMNQALKGYVFIPFAIVMVLAVLFIFFKIPETKGRTAEDIMAHFSRNKSTSNNDNSKGQVQLKTIN